MYFELFQGAHQYWYWRLFAEKNKNIAFCSNGYPNKNDAIEGIHMLQSLTPMATIKELETKELKAA